MKQSLLDMVQDILSELDLDPVNSINDTPEAMQVARIIRTSYLNLVEHRTFPSHKELSPLDALSDTAYPNYLKVPVDVQELDWINYDTQRAEDAGRSRFNKITYQYPDEFLAQIQRRNSLEANVLTVTDFAGTSLLIRNDLAPTYWTSFDDSYIVFDSYDAEMDITLQANKSQAFLQREPTFSIADDFTPDLPTEAFSLLVEEAKSRSSLSLNQEINPIADREAARQRRRMSRKNWQAAGGVRYPNYGRRPRRGSRLIDKNGTYTP